MLEDPGLGIVGARNVHGILGRTETIFGIDGKDVPEDNPALSFTKTYRLMSLVPYENETVKLCDSDTSYIKIFGHSLSRADYSYFQSIFDTVNLYGCDTKLVFMYKSYPNTVSYTHLSRRTPAPGAHGSRIANPSPSASRSR